MHGPVRLQLIFMFTGVQCRTANRAVKKNNKTRFFSLVCLDRLFLNIITFFTSC